MARTSVASRFEDRRGEGYSKSLEGSKIKHSSGP